MYLKLTNLANGKAVLVNSVRTDFIDIDDKGHAVFINKQQEPLTVCESFEMVWDMLTGCDLEMPLK